MDEIEQIKDIVFNTIMAVEDAKNSLYSALAIAERNKYDAIVSYIEDGISSCDSLITELDIYFNEDENLL